MVLKPGDDVQVGSCEPVGNFPHGLLTNPDALALEPGAFGSTMCLTERKEDYIDAFDAQNLVVCNEDQFAKLHTPYILHLEEKEEEEPPDDKIGKDRCIAIYGVASAYNVVSKGPWTFLGQKITSDSWYLSQNQQGMGFFLNQNAGGGVSIRVDLVGAYQGHVEVLGGCRPNGFFFGELLVNWQVYNINAPSLSGVRIDWSVQATCCDDSGCSTHLYSQSGNLGEVAFEQQVHVVGSGVIGQCSITRYIDGHVHLGLVPKDGYGYVEDINPFDPGGG